MASPIPRQRTQTARQFGGAPWRNASLLSESKHRDFIARQHVFFTASAAATGHVNLSPRSTDMLRVLGSNRVVYLDRTGSGNETAAHMLADGRLTIMLCAFDGPPLIMRLYGQPRAAPSAATHRNIRRCWRPSMETPSRLAPAR